jgi:hypothetical protein
VSTGDHSHPRVEKESCRTCAHRVRCHGKAPDVTQDTILQLIDEALREVLRQPDARKKRG